MSLAERLNDGPPRWLPALACALSALGGMALGRAGNGLADVAIGSGLLVLAGLSPPLGLLALVSTAFSGPLAIATGTQTRVVAAALLLPLLTCLWLIRLVVRRDAGALRLPAVRAAVALAITAVLAALVGNLPGVGFGITAPLTAQLGATAVFGLSAAALALGADQLRDRRMLARLTWLYIGFGIVLVASRVIPEMQPPAWWLVQPLTDGSLTWTWFAALASAQAIRNRTLNWRVRLLLGLCVLTLLGYSLTVSREWVSGWLPPLVAVGAAICLSMPRLGAVGVVTAAVLIASHIPALTRQLMIGDNRYSLETRLGAWRVLAKIWAANPLLGIGPANYYHVTPLFDLRGYHVNFSSHSTYADLLAQTGLLGLACFAWCCWAIGREGWRLYRYAPAGFASAYATGALAGLVGTLAAGGLGDWVLPFVYNVTLYGLRTTLPAWLLMGGLLALGQTVPAPAPRPRHLERYALPAIVAVAVLLRIGAAIWLGDTAAPLSGAYDQYSYDTLAQRVLAGEGFSFPTGWYPFTAAGEPTAHWSFLYTLYLAAVYGVVGHHPLAARLLQALASGAGCWLILRIGRRLFDTRVGIAAAALTALYAYFIFFNAALMTQTFFILALLVAFDRALAIESRPTVRAWAALGVALGAGVLLRQTLLLFTPVLLLWLVWRTRGRLRWSGPLLAVALVALAVLPWTVRNQRVFGEFLLLNSNGGYFFYAANHPDQGTTFDPNYVAPLPEALRGEPEPSIDRALFRAAFAFITADPLRFARLSWSRIGSYYWLLPSAESSPTSNGMRLCSFTVYAPLMLYGLVLSLRRWRLCLPLYLYVAFDAALHLSSWAAPRYRLPSDAVLMVFAGLAVVDLATRLARWTTRSDDRPVSVPAAPIASYGGQRPTA